MRKNESPWLTQLDRARVPQRLRENIETDVAIIGGGIAGVATAFFTLKHTDKKVVLVERSLLAHGATGHNAGQVVSYFERGFTSLVQEFGLAAAAEAEQSIVDAWGLIKEMYRDAGLSIPFSEFMGHGGLTSFQQVKWHLEANRLRRKGGIAVRALLVSEDAPFARAIPREYDGIYKLVPQEEINRRLETELPGFVGVISYKKGCVNSALFCQEVVRYLLRHYPNRFSVYEHTPVHKVLLRNDHAILDADTHTIDAVRVVLCTNGFEHIHIINEHGLDIDAKYHHLVYGRVGYMSAYLEETKKPPIAISYYMDPVPGMENDYVYLTRRPFDTPKKNCTLVCVAGTSFVLDEREQYQYEEGVPEQIEKDIDEFVHKVYDLDPGERITYQFTWHGLMGYTQNGVRMIGPEPQNKTLLYNLGCNGVGILPSIYGGRRIARFLAGEQLKRTIFDVPKRAGGTRAGEMTARAVEASHTPPGR